MRFRKILSGLTSLALSVSAFAGLGVADLARTVSVQAASTNWKFDFGGSGAAGGYTGVSASDGYDQGRGYGFAQTWNVANVSAGGNGVLADAVQFKDYGTGNTFNVDLPKGLYEVKVTVGNAPRTTIKLEGMVQMMNLTGRGAAETVKIPVTDGQLNIQAVEGMSNREQSIASVEITQLNDTGEMPPTVWICGDSTVASYYNCADTSQHGWGQFFNGKLGGTTFDVRNMATSGQYAKGFVDAGQFAPIETYGKTGDYYIISIGINDSNYSNETEYYNTVTDMVKRAKAKGMTVVLVKQQGRRGDLQRSPRLTGRWYGSSLDKIGSEQSVQVVDLFTRWQNFGLSVGYDGMASYYAIKNDGTADDLHQSKMGAQKIAEIMLEEIQSGAREPIHPDSNVSYMFRNINSGLYMEVADGSLTSGANVQQGQSGVSQLHNTWKCIQATGDYYYIKPVNSELCLYVDSGSRDNGANIVVADKNGYSDQFFKFADNGDGTVTILTRASRDVSAVEVGSASMNSGANVQQWEVNGHDCQKWEMIEVDDIVVTVPTTTTTLTETTTTTVTTTAETTTSYIFDIFIEYGDANCDGDVDLSDAVLIMQALANPNKYGIGGTGRAITEEGVRNADVTGNEDGMTVADALFIQTYLLGLNDLPTPVNVVIAPTTTTTTEVSTTTTTTAAPVPVKYYAADQTWNDGIIEMVNSGYTCDKGYVNLGNNTDSNITFTVNVSSDGNYMTHIRFANGSTSDRKMKLFVNNNFDSCWMQSFPGTGSWTDWQEYGIVLPLKAGNNTILMQSAMSEGAPNIDYIELIITDEPYAEIYDPSQEQQSSGGGQRTLYIAGDSTAQSYRESYAPQQGWGYYMKDYFNGDITVANHSIAGRSSKKFYDEGRWQTIADSLNEGDFVMIQFAINDAGSANADRYAPTCGNVDNPSSGSYEWYMTQFIRSAKDKGATPILVTTTIGMKAYSNGRFSNSYTNYNEACYNLARKYNIPCIDLNSIMVDHYNSVGYDTAKSYHLMGAVAGSTDGTHFCEKGANIVAGLVAGEIRKQGISGLASYLK
ncbi:GDSL-type esterase/lipase family protein [Ruminococcus sp.]|uniref:GDSL-type esterase/lipase family protein n=1 Tax=Ruminococcus sp. TaxID=41978 RepID=UPI001B5EE25D|nr:GDSL-type esterase/lipase family protein [Ruminococcus sp.]MBP5432943.1 RICIN domain-containing protein [Ruminococcus sp.]